MKTISVLMTSYNRCEYTINSLDCLFSSIYPVDVYLVDDNSNDNTVEQVSTLFPKVNIYHGDGNLFWNRGMALAWSHACKNDYDFYIWLNDDVVLYPQWLDELMACYQQAGANSIITGIIENHEANKIIYGGYDSVRKLIEPNEQLQEVTSMNGNVVLISREVYNQLGGLDPVFHHDLGDVDYGFRAKKKGISVYTTRIAVGRGETNDFCRVRKRGVGMFTRFKKLYSPLGSNPFINFYFRKKHIGFCNALGYFFFLNMINIMSDRIVDIVFGNRYK